MRDLSRTKLMTELDSLLMDAKRAEIRFVVEKELELKSRIAALEKERDRLVHRNASLAATVRQERGRTEVLRLEYDRGLAALLREHEVELEKAHRQRAEEARTREEIKDAFRAVLEKNRAHADSLRAAQLRVADLEDRLAEARAMLGEQAESLRQARARESKADLEKAVRDLQSFQSQARDAKDQADRALRQLEKANARVALLEESISSDPEPSSPSAAKVKYLERRLAESDKKIRSLAERIQELGEAPGPDG